MNSPHPPIPHPINELFMYNLNQDGMLVDPRIQLRRQSSIEHGNLIKVHAIVVHQTDSSTAQSTFAGYAKNGGSGNGAHFLIEKNGTIYQTASLKKRCYHIGKLIKSRCLEINGKNCADPSYAKIAAMGWSAQMKRINQVEREKKYPERYPVNSDSIGIEIVGKSLDANSYEALSLAQNNSLHWLIDLLYQEFNIGSSDIYRHPEVSYKNPGEARSATWE